MNRIHHKDLTGGSSTWSKCFFVRPPPPSDEVIELSVHEGIPKNEAALSQDARSLHPDFPHGDSRMCWRKNYNTPRQVGDRFWTAGWEPIGEKKASEHNPNFGEAVAGFLRGLPEELQPQRPCQRPPHDDWGKRNQVWEAYPCCLDPSKQGNLRINLFGKENDLHKEVSVKSTSAQKLDPNRSESERPRGKSHLRRQNRRQTSFLGKEYKAEEILRRESLRCEPFVFPTVRINP